MSVASDARAATDAQLTANIRASTRHEPVSTRLTTHKRVLALVADGIPRQPGSAVRIPKSISDVRPSELGAGSLNPT